jgi:hypothetical protein
VVVDGREIVMEGGAIDVDGRGTLMATEECLLSPVQARNPGLGREGIERVFGEVLGIERVIWLGRGIVGDDTHGHIDDLARFVAPGRILLCDEKNPKDENYEILNENRERLQSAKLEVIPLPMPAPITFDGQRVPASYANFYIANGTVIVPTFNDPNDRHALGLIADLFPTARSSGSTAWISSGAWARSTARLTGARGYYLRTADARGSRGRPPPQVRRRDRPRSRTSPFTVRRGARSVGLLAPQRWRATEHQRSA